MAQIGLQDDQLWPRWDARVTSYGSDWTERRRKKVAEAAPEAAAEPAEPAVEPAEEPDTAAVADAVQVDFC